MKWIDICNSWTNINPFGHNFYMIGYELALYFLSLCAAPKLLYHRMRYGKYRHFFEKRSGQGLLAIDKGSRPLIWIHAVSVGETKAIAPLAKKLKDSPMRPLIITTSITETGLQEATRTLPFADHHFYMPLDFSWLIRPLVKKLKPEMVIISETDLWYNFLDEAKNNGARLFLVNGKISDRSFHRLSYLPRFSMRLYSLFDHAFIQSEQYGKHFEKLGLPHEKMTVTGNIKLDTPSPPRDPSFLKSFIATSPLLVAGSTHFGEEEIVLKTYQKLLEEFPSLKLIIVPRHPERFQEVWKRIEEMKIPSMRYSQEEIPDAKICLIDQMGLLNLCYAQSTIALVCGSFVPGIGGHNIFEPAYYKKPILFGPYMDNQKDFVTLLSSSEAAIQTPADHLLTHLRRLLKSPRECTERGEMGYSILSHSQGATEKTYEGLISHCS